MTSSPGTPPAAEITTILAADIGSARTKVSLFANTPESGWKRRGTAEALTTAQAPMEGVMGGLSTAAHELERAVCRRLMAKTGGLMIGGSQKAGADALVAVSSAAPPLRLVTLATTAQRSGLWADVASRWSITQVIDRAVLDSGDGAGMEQRWADASHQNGWSDVAAKIRLLSPDAILLTGGYDGGALAPVIEIVQALVGLRAAGGPPLTVVYAGNHSAVPRLAALLAGRADLRIVDNVLPRAGDARPAPAGEALDELYSERKLGSLNGFSAVAGLSSAPVLSSARALTMVWNMLAELWQEPVLGLDLGAATTIAATAGQQAACVRVQPDLGANMGWDNPLHPIEASALARWLPVPLSKTEIQTRLAAQHNPLTLPQNIDAVLFQEALAREAWRALLSTETSDAPLTPAPALKALNIVASGGVVAHSPSLWRLALVMLDAAEPCGLVNLWVDRADILPQLGALAAVKRDAALSILKSEAIDKLALAVCLAGSTAPGSKAADVELRLEDGSVRRTIVAWGSLHVVHTAGLGVVTVTVRPVRGVYIPGQPDDRPLVTTISNCELGVILDCRSHPLVALLDPEHSHARVRSWIAAGDQ